MNATLFVCTTCHVDQPTVERQPVAGARLYSALADKPMPKNLTIAPVECLSAYGNGCAVALSAPGCWSYVYGRLSEGDAADGTTAYAATPDSQVPWGQRPQIFRKQSLTCISPQKR